MSTHTFACPACLTSYSVSNDKVGRRTACKKCGEKFVVPLPPKPEPEVALDADLLLEPLTLRCDCGRAIERPGKWKWCPDCGRNLDNEPSAGEPGFATEAVYPAKTSAKYAPVFVTLMLVLLGLVAAAIGVNIDRDRSDKREIERSNSINNFRSSLAFSTSNPSMLKVHTPEKTDRTLVWFLAGSAVFVGGLMAVCLVVVVSRR